jgi:hypothetical protein
MSMADDHTLGSYRSNDPHRRAAEPSHPNEKTGASDPLAELARLIGQRDPFAEFGRSNSRQTKRQVQEPLPASAADQWRAPAPEQQFAADDTSGRDAYASTPDYALPSAHDVRGAESHVYEEVPLAADHQGQYHGDHYDEDHLHEEQVHEEQQHADQSQGGYGADQYYQDDVPLTPNDDDMYDDPPRARQRGGLTTALALVGCALLGTVGAYAFRSYYAEPSATQSPPIITADNSTPTKIVPASAGEPGKGAQDRPVSAEQLVSKQEEPVALKESAPQAAPRLAAPAPAAAAGSAAQQPSAGSAPASTEPKKVRTVVIRPDGGTDMSARPVGAPAAQGSVATAPTSPPRPAAAAPAPKAATATAPSATDNASGGFVVQLSSQKSESEALASFRSLQAKFPDELGGRQPIIRRADLGSKGIFYRTLVGPFASAHEASQFCASYKAAGGQCVVPSN